MISTMYPKQKRELVIRDLDLESSANLQRIRHLPASLQYLMPFEKRELLREMRYDHQRSALSAPYSREVRAFRYWF